MPSLKLPTQNDRTGPRPGWLILFIALSLVIITVYFREGDTGPVHRVQVGVQSVAAPFSAAGEWMTRPARNLISWASDLGVSRSQLQSLREQNASLRSRVAELEEARLENERLRKLVSIVQAGDLDAVAAHVIGRPTNSWEGVITIDRGTKEGVVRGMPVVGPDGLLGQVVQSGPTSAKVRLISDQRSGVAAIVQRSRAEGVVRGSIEGRLTLDFVSSDTTVTVGDVVVSSGLGGIYPKGLVIGEVSDVRRVSNELYQEISVMPAGDIGGLEEVLVLRVPTAGTTQPEGGE